MLINIFLRLAIARKSITQDACTELLDYLRQDNGTFSSDQCKEFARIAVTRCNALQNQGGAAANEDENQTNMYLHLYYPDWLWSVLKSDESMTNKLSHQAEFWVKHLGLRHASEVTKRLGVAIAQVAAGEAIDPQLGCSRPMPRSPWVIDGRSPLANHVNC